MQPRVSPVTRLIFPSVRWVASRSRLLELPIFLSHIPYAEFVMDINRIPFSPVQIKINCRDPAERGGVNNLISRMGVVDF
jgi:hypothetical protein